MVKLPQYKNRVQDMGCIICQRPAELHHPRFCAGLSQRASDWLVIPLCPEHHRSGGYGIALHADQTAFERNYGTEEELLSTTIERYNARYG